MSYARTALLLLATITGCAAAQAQNLSVPPRFDDPGCGGILCHPRDPSAPDPRDPAQAAAIAAALGPPCGGILCDIDPVGMRRPTTAADVREAERARAEAAPPAPPPEATPEPRHRQAKARATVKRRTADAAATKAEAAK